MPQRRWRKLRAVRSPLRRAIVGPLTRASLSDWWKAEPSRNRSMKMTDGSSFSKTRRATGRPARTPSSLARKKA
jgi:hypothetical protein